MEGWMQLLEYYVKFCGALLVTVFPQGCPLGTICKRKPIWVDLSPLSYHPSVSWLKYLHNQIQLTIMGLVLHENFPDFCAHLFVFHFVFKYLYQLQYCGIPNVFFLVSILNPYPDLDLDSFVSCDILIMDLYIGGPCHILSSQQTIN